MNTIVASMLELVVLDELLKDDCKCESRTHNQGRVVCSGDVAYRLSSCLPAVNVCTNMGAATIQAMRDPARRCAHCSEYISDHWRIRSV